MRPNRILVVWIEKEEWIASHKEHQEFLGGSAIPTSTPHPCAATRTMKKSSHTHTVKRPTPTSQKTQHTHAWWMSTTHKNNHTISHSTHESTLPHTVLDKEISTIALCDRTNNIQTQGSKELIEVSPLADVDLATTVEAVQVLPNGAHKWRGWRTLALTLWVHSEVASVA